MVFRRSLFKLLKAFGKDEEFKHIDLVKVAGGAQALANGPSPARDFVIDQIKKSIRLHTTKRVILMLHEDCGAYGGSAAFAARDAEFANHENQLRLAERFLRNEIPGLAIECYFAAFDGLYAVQPDASVPLEDAVAA